ncbi:MAG: DegT/DnrJ/EryC1/StrS family aminotransferase [Lentimicrobiaceae bacterium]|nr:DegT/DnrJ/EryC1/StrS family aminotransferase [Lentimicrobiaceae bacterium]MCB9023607.1 DegT/DnrJ/EryC1/StrS family aminotransferase [Lentimicrobiaceae bacterium]MCO5264360.1 DegT/DnrJ/EryC1/StrS family aminotransferase [Lentimicrobium sp.]HPG33579.1 DegT/DnrJ/EryC1/StrS family aminotransferase [Lentimicrobium sp.]
MNKIAMVDLKGQYEKIKPEIDQAISDVINSTAFINGPAVKSFQEDLEAYLGVKHVIPCANGTDALQVAMMALGIKPGDEVITTNFTFIATAEVIALLGFTPVVVDVDPGTFNIDPESVRKAITPKTKAIVPVHLFGQCADMDAMLEIAREFNLFVIEDTCQAIGADYIFADGTRKKAGTIGHVGCTSFFPSKNLGCYGDGGAIFTNDDELAKQLRVVVNHGMTVRYYHDYIGVNSRLDSIQAAILKVKLARLDEYAEARNRAAAFYDKAFANNPKLKTPERFAKSTHVFHQYTLVTEGIDRNALQEFLSKKDVPAMIYYPVPLHMQKAYLDPRYREGDFPVTEHLCRTVISLPMHTELDEEQLAHITSSVLEFVNA